MKNKISFSLFGLCLATQLLAQGPFNCTEALEICGTNSVLIDYPEAYTDMPTVVAEDCSGPFPSFFALDSNIVWLKLVFETSGEFYFTLDPLNPEDDLDFVVFEAPLGDCSELAAVRCMYSGENISAPSSPCLGATGLAPGSTDFAEGPGCSIGDDNFLAPIEVEAGAIVYVLAASWATDPHFEFSFGGTASLFACAPNATYSQEQNSGFRVQPNPAQGRLRLTQLPAAHRLDLQILDVNGRQVRQIPAYSGEDISIADLRRGIYILRLSDRHGGIWQERVSIH